MKAHTPVIRRVQPSEAALVATLHGRCFEEGWSLDFMTRLLRSSGVTAYVAEDDGSAAGFAVARIAADEAELLTIGVVPDARGRGVGTALARAAMTWARAHGARKLHLEVAETNRPARALYEALAFEQVGRRTGYYDDGRVDALTLALGLRLS